MTSPPLAPRTLTTSSKRILAMLVGAVAFTLGGALMIADGDGFGWFVVAFFGLCAVVFVVQAIPGMSRLRLELDHFEVRSIGRSTRMPWGDVTEFSVGHMPRLGERVFYDARIGSDTRRGWIPWLTDLAASLGGGKPAMLPENYGLSAEELAALMEQYRIAASARDA